MGSCAGDDELEHPVDPIAETPEKGRKRCGQKSIEDCEKYVIFPPARTGVLMEDTRRKQLHFAKVKMINLMVNNEDNILSVLSLVETDMAQASNLKSLDDPLMRDSFHSTYTTFKSLPKYYMAARLTACHPAWFTTLVIEWMERMSKSMVRETFYLKHAIDDNTKWPPSLKRKGALDLYFDHRDDQVGRRFSEEFLKERVNPKSGQVTKMVAYDVVDRKKDADADTYELDIAHISGSKVPNCGLSV